MNADQREAELRLRVARFRDLSVADRVALPAAEYGHLADCAFLLDLVDALRTTLAHTPTRQTRALMALPADAAPPPAPTIPAPPTRSDLPWSDPANRA